MVFDKPEVFRQDNQARSSPVGVGAATPYNRYVAPFLEEVGTSVLDAVGSPLFFHAASDAPRLAKKLPQSIFSHSINRSLLADRWLFTDNQFLEY